MKVSFLKPKFPKLHNVKKHLNKMYANGQFSNNGPLVQEFEKKITKYMEYDGDAITCSNGTIALMIALACSGKKKALVPSFTFPATIQSLIWCGIDFDYVDINRDTWNIDVDDLHEKLKTKKYDLIFPVHSFGNPCDVEEIEALSNIFDCYTIYDGAAGMASFYESNGEFKHISNYGDMVCFSTHATKVLPTGEGGIVFVKDKNKGQELREMCNFGFKNDRIPHQTYGLNAKMSEINACFGLSALESLSDDQKYRIDIVKFYKDQLSEYFTFQKQINNSISSHQTFQILCNSEEEREYLLVKMAEKGIECRKYYNPCLHTLPRFYRGVVNLQNTDYVSSRILSIPLHLWMNRDEATYVIDSLISLVKEFRP